MGSFRPENNKFTDNYVLNNYWEFGDYCYDSNIILMDSEKNRMYIKTSDNIGMCNLRIFDFTEVTETSQGHNSVATQPDLSQYVTRDELNNILEQLNGGKDNEQSVQPTKSNKSTSTK